MAATKRRARHGNEVPDLIVGRPGQLLLAFLHDQRGVGKRLGTEYGETERQALASAHNEFARSEHERSAST
jgi:hypothetical protein